MGLIYYCNTGKNRDCKLLKRYYYFVETKVKK